MDRKIILIIYACYLLVLSSITFLTYAIDKNKAKRGGWRVKEKVLLLMSILGGAFGGILAMKKFRHKTKGEHWYFTAINVIGIIIHVALLICIAFVFEI